MSEICKFECRILNNLTGLHNNLSNEIDFTYPYKVT